MKEIGKHYESIKSKLAKLQVLAERGSGGEAEAARRAIERICAQYGIDLEDLLNVDKQYHYVFEVGRAKDLFRLFVRCLDSVCDISGMTYTAPTRSSVEVKLTALQYAETLSLFDWHKDNYKKEFEKFRRSFFSAYIGKHNLLFSKERQDAGDVELTQDDIDRLRRIWGLRNAMSDVTYHKLLENGNC